jgi:hypothetical protein
MDQGDQPECLLGATANVVRIVLYTDAFWGGRSPPGSRPIPIVRLVDDADTLVGQLPIRGAGGRTGQLGLARQTAPEALDEI